MPQLDAESLLARLLYRDAMMLVVDKPSGIAVHKGPGSGDNLEAHFHALTFGLPRNPALAHRLDRETSGCLVLGRHRKALAKLGQLFKTGQITKTYWAVVRGTPPDEAGIITLPLVRRSQDARSWWMKVAGEGDKGAEPAETHYRVLGRAEGLTWLELEPKTGRTHQLRVHCAAIGCAIAGDALYGDDAARAEAPRTQLHARAVAIPLYPKRGPVIVTAPVPDDMAAILRQCGFTGESIASESMSAESVIPEAGAPHAA
jgi:tRNA pseudouridine32 synthase / 23S rRNA pseudouridine746 synthase